MSEEHSDNLSDTENVTTINKYNYLHITYIIYFIPSVLYFINKYITIIIYSHILLIHML